MPLIPPQMPRRRPRTPEYSGAGDVSLIGDGRGGLVARDGRPDPEWGRIASHVSANEYTAIRLDDGDTAYPDRDTLTVQCWELNGRTDVAVDTLVRLEPNRAGDGFTFVAPPDAGVTGSGTDNRVVRWDGTSAIQDSHAVLNDSGALKLSDISGPSLTQRELTLRTYTFGLGDQAAVLEGRMSGSGGTYQDYQLSFTANSTGNINTMFLGFGDATFGLNDGLTYVNTSNDGSGQLYVGSDGAGATYSTSVKLGGSVAASVQLDNRNVSPSVQNLVVSFGSDTAGYSATVSGVVRDGVTGTLAPGALFAGGICYDLGTGSFVGTASNNSFTNQNSFSPANSSTVPVTIQGAASQSANLTEWKDSGGTVLASVSAAGVLTAAALNGTYDAGTW